MWRCSTAQPGNLSLLSSISLESWHISYISANVPYAVFSLNTQPLSCLTFVLCVSSAAQGVCFSLPLRPTPLLLWQTTQLIDPPTHRATQWTTQGTYTKTQRRRTQQIIFNRKSSQKAARKQRKTTMTLRCNPYSPVPLSKQNSNEPVERQVARRFAFFGEGRSLWGTHFLSV